MELACAKLGIACGEADAQARRGVLGQSGQVYADHIVILQLKNLDNLMFTVSQRMGSYTAKLNRSRASWMKTFLSRKHENTKTLKKIIKFRAFTISCFRDWF